MTIKPSKVGNVILTEADIAQAMVELSGELQLSVAEVQRQVLPHAGARDAAGWAAGIATVVQAARASSEQSTGPSTADLIRDYERRFPAHDSSGNRLALTETGQRLCATAAAGNRPMSASEAAMEANRICLSYQGSPAAGRPKWDMAQIAGQSIEAAPVALSETRLYDEDSDTLALSAGTDIDAYLTKLSAGRNGACISLAGQGNASVYDTTNAPSVSDLSGQTLPLPQGYAAAFSPEAQQEIASLPASMKAALQTELDIAAKGSPADAATALIRAIAHAGACRNLRSELHIRARAAIDAAASFQVDPQAAQVQSAGGYNVEDEVRRLSQSASAPRVGNTTGNK